MMKQSMTQDKRSEKKSFSLNKNYFQQLNLYEGGKSKTVRGIFLAGLIFLSVSYIHAAELVGYWKMDEKKGKIVKNSVGEFHGKVYGNAKWVEGKNGSAIEFDGKTRIEIKDTSKSCFDLTSMSLSAWIKVKNYPVRSPIWRSGIVGKSLGRMSTYGLYLSCDKRISFSISTGWRGKRFRYHSKAAIKLGQWTYVVVTYDKQKVKFYINGKLDSVFEETNLPSVNNQNILIGSVFGSQHNGKGGRFFEGIIDDVKIYNGALTQEEIINEYQINGGRVVSAPRLDVPPILDGKLNEACWRKAAKLSLVRTIDGNPPITKTTGYVAYDDNNLYIGFNCLEPYMDRIKATQKMDGNISIDDCVEVFLGNCKNSGCYFQFLLNTIESRKMIKYLKGKTIEGWNADWQGKVFKGEDFWSAEILIPFSSLAYGPDTDCTWKLNLARERKIKKGQENLAWSPTGRLLNRPEKFGIMKGIDIDTSFYNIGLSLPSLNRIVGKDKLSLEYSQIIYNYSGRPRNVILRMTDIISGCKLVKELTLNDVCNTPQGTQPGQKEIAFPIPFNEKENQYICKVEITDKLTNKRISLSSFTVKTPSLLKTYLDRDYYTTEKTARLHCQIEMEKTSISKLIAQLVLQDEKGNTVLSKNIPRPEKVFAINVEDIPCGKYKGMVNLMLGNKLVSFDKFQLLKQSKTRYEIKIDREKLIPLVNGKPFFAIGLMGLPLGKIAEYASAGFNITTGVGANALDTAYYNNMLFVTATYATTPRKFFFTKSHDELERIIRKGRLIPRIKKHQYHPAFFGYYWDEPVGKGLAVEHKITKECDPYHPIWSIFWNYDVPPSPLPSNIYDILGNDPYWFPGKGDNITKSGLLVERYWRLAQMERKPLWITPQADGWSDLSIITPDQQKCQTYLHLIKGARGIFYWTYRIITPLMKKMLKKLAGELKELTPILLTQSPLQKVNGNIKTGIEVLAKTYGNSIYLICTSTNVDLKQDIKIRLSGIKQVSNKKVVMPLSKLFIRDKVELKNNAAIIKDKFEPYATRVYKIDGIPIDLNKPIKMEFELVSSEKIPNQNKRQIKSKELSKNITLRSLWRPTNTDWRTVSWQDVNGIISIEKDPSYKYKKYIRLNTSKNIIYTKKNGYGWNKCDYVLGVDLCSTNSLLRDCNKVSKGIFKVDLPNGKYKISATMRPPVKIFELENGQRQKLELKALEIPEIVKAFPAFENRLREYTSEVNIKDGSIDIGINSGSIFSLIITSVNKVLEKYQFDFGSNNSPVEKNYKPIIAPNYIPSVWYKDPELKVSGGKEYNLSVDMNCMTENRTIRIGIFDTNNWSVHWKIFKLKKGWNNYSFSCKTRLDQSGKVMIRFVPDTESGSIGLGKVEFKEKK